MHTSVCSKVGLSCTEFELVPGVRTGAATVQDRIQQLRGAGEHSEWKSQQQGLSDARVRLQGHFERVTGSQCRRATAQALLTRLEKEKTSNP